MTARWTQKKIMAISKKILTNLSPTRSLLTRDISWSAVGAGPLIPVSWDMICIANFDELCGIGNSPIGMPRILSIVYWSNLKLTLSCSFIVLDEVSKFSASMVAVTLGKGEHFNSRRVPKPLSLTSCYWSGVRSCNNFLNFGNDNLVVISCVPWFQKKKAVNKRGNIRVPTGKKKAYKKSRKGAEVGS